MYFVDEQYRTSALAKHTAGIATTPVDDLTHFFDPGSNRRDGVERGINGLRNDACQCGFAHPGRTPEDERCDIARLNHTADYATGSDEMGLPDILVECGRAQPFGKRS